MCLDLLLHAFAKVASKALQLGFSVDALAQHVRHPEWQIRCFSIIIGVRFDSGQCSNAMVVRVVTVWPVFLHLCGQVLTLRERSEKIKDEQNVTIQVAEPGRRASAGWSFAVRSWELAGAGVKVSRSSRVQGACRKFLDHLVQLLFFQTCLRVE